MKFSSLFGGVALPVLASGDGVPAMAQSVSSSIRGTVIDADGFAVPGASIAIKNEGHRPVQHHDLVRTAASSTPRGCRSAAPTR